MDRNVVSRFRADAAVGGSGAMTAATVRLASFLVMACLPALAVSAQAASGAGEIFGPARYEVRERYGRENRYQETIKAADGLYVVYVQNGTVSAERPDILTIDINGMRVVGAEPLRHLALFRVLQLRKQNTLEISMKDHKPSGMRRPALKPKFIVLSVAPLSRQYPEGLFGAADEKGFHALMDVMRRIGSRRGLAYALAAVDLHHPAEERARAMRGLAAERDAAARDFLVMAALDPWTRAEVRAEAMLGAGMLGDVSLMPVLTSGLLDHEEKVRSAAARAMALFPEETTSAPVREMLGSMDPIRTAAFIRAIADAGWKPVRTLTDAAGSPDPVVANKAVEILGSIDDPQVLGLLLGYLSSPGKRSTSVIISALGATGNGRAADPLLVIANDPVKRKGNEVALGAALADLGEQRGVKPIRSMAKSVATSIEFMALAEAYRRLTGEELRP